MLQRPAARAAGTATSASRGELSRWPWLVAATLIAAVSMPSMSAQGHFRGSRSSVDVACDFNTIRFEGPQGPNPNDASDVGPHPYYGASFVVQGVIYPEGTLDPSCDPSVSNCGLLPDGTPEFPDLVVGRWICRGWFIGDSNDPARGGIFTPTGPFVATTQIYDFNPDSPGSRMLISEGMELIDLNVPFRRAVTGGSGRFAGARGQVTQTAIGANSTGLFNFNFDFRVRPRRALFR